MSEILSQRPDIIFQISFTIVVSSIFFWQAWVAYKNIFTR